MNCLVLDPKDRHRGGLRVYQQEQMDKLGMNASSCDLRAYRSAAACCSTTDVYREGSASTFPNRVEDPTLVRPEMWK